MQPPSHVPKGASARKRAQGLDLGSTISIAGAVGLGVAAIDVVVARLGSPDANWIFLDYVDSAGLTAAATALVFLGLSLALLVPRRFFGLNARALLAALALGAAGSHAGLTLARLFHRWVPIEDLWPAPVLGITTFVAAYPLGAHHARRGGRLLRAVVAGFAVELGFAAMFGAFGAGVEAERIASGLAVLVVATAAVLALCSRFDRALEGGRARAVIWILLVLVAAHPFATLKNRAPRFPVGAAPVSAGSDRVQRCLLIVVDTLRADELSCFGSTAVETPALDLLARDGIVFEAARAPAGWTRPSVVSIMTGLSPLVHGSNEATRALSQEATTLAESFRKAGWRTAAFGENALLLPPSGLAQGFELYDFFPRYHANPPLGKLLMNAAWPDRMLRGLLAPDLTRFALRWLDAHPAEPTFAWLHYLDVHQPYTPAPSFGPKAAPPPGMSRRFGELDPIRLGLMTPNLEEREWIRALYRAEIRQLDSEIGNLLDGLRERGIYDDTTIVFTSDHGEEFWEHGGYEHGHTLYDELLRVPLIVKLPQSAGAGARVPASVTIESIAPTLLGVIGIAFDPAAFSAPALVDATGEVFDNHAPAVLFSEGNARGIDRSAIISDGRKYVRWSDGSLEELYDLSSDPAELHSLVDAAPDILEDYRDRFGDTVRQGLQLAEAIGIGRSLDRELDEATRAELRKLGYIR